MDEKDLVAAQAIETAIRMAQPRQTIVGVAKRIGVSRNVLQNVVIGRTAPDDDLLDRIRRDLKLPKNWPTIPQNKPDLHRVSLAGTPLKPIRIVGLASAGDGIANVDVQGDVVFVPERLAQIGGLGWLVDGESMMPYLEPGDVAIFRESRQPRRGFTYLMKNEEAEFRVKTMDWADGKWVAKSLNPAYSAAPLEGWEILGFLIGWYRTKGSRETMDSDPNGLLL